jgi:AcrR family transcriptional regulator
MDNRTAKKNQVTADAILTVAEELLADGGMAAVTLDAIARRADVAVQTIYNRVGGRPAVLAAVAEKALAANREYLDEAYGDPAPPLDRIRGVAAAYVRFATEKPNQYRLLAEPPADVPGAATIAALTSDQNGKFAALIQEGIDQGVIAPDLDPTLTATVLWRAWDGVLGLMFRTGAPAVGEAEMETLLGHLERIIGLGLTPRPLDAPAATGRTSSRRMPASP